MYGSEKVKQDLGIRVKKNSNLYKLTGIAFSQPGHQYENIACRSKSKRHRVSKTSHSKLV